MTLAPKDSSEGSAPARAEPSPESRFRALLDGVADPVLAIDGRRIVREASRAVLDVLGWPPAELVGNDLSVLIGEPHRRELDARLARCRETGAVEVLGRTRELEVARRDGTRVVCELALAPVRVPGEAEPLVVGTLRDVGERARAVSELAERLEHARRREADTLRALASIGDSASILVHEIKNPITGIHLAIQAVAEQLGEDHRAILRDLEDSLGRVERTMRRTLSFAKPLELARRPVDVESLLERVVRRLRGERAGAEIALEIACEPGLVPVELDPDLVEAALAELVRNALESFSPGGRVRLSARLDGDELELRVDDDGPGIPGYVLPNLFKPFVTTKASGAGIGLALCKKIVERHGGTIRHVPGRLGGACFEIRLPR